MDQRERQHDFLFPSGQLYRGQRGSEFADALLYEINTDDKLKTVTELQWLQALRSVLQNAVLVVGSAARMLFPVCDRAFILATLRQPTKTTHSSDARIACSHCNYCCCDTVTIHRLYTTTQKHLGLA